MFKKITDSVVYIGANDHDLDMFEGQYIIPNGMAYNSYIVFDEKIAVIDSIDKSKTSEWLGNIRELLGDRAPYYLIIQHMEPDHSASIGAFVNEYPDTTLVGNKKTFKMIEQFFPHMKLENCREVENGDELMLGTRKLSFLFAPMVHWPEVMMTYDAFDRILFSADAFGKFGALDVEEDWACEARRYYIGIVGKYGAQVQAVLKELAKLSVEIICPLHGPVLKDDLEYYIDLYDTWSSYRPESAGVCICYTSVYGNTKKAVEILADELSEKGVTVAVNDLARCDMAEAVEDAFRYDRLVLATTTYNGDVFPFMKHFIEALTERNFQNRFVAFIENGSWGPTAMRTMKGMLEKSKELIFADNSVTIRSALNDESEAKVKALAEELFSCRKSDEEETAEADSQEKESEKKKGFVCDICGYVYEGDELPEDFVCPICKVGADQFSPL